MNSAKHMLVLWSFVVKQSGTGGRLTDGDYFEESFIKISEHLFSDLNNKSVKLCRKAGICPSQNSFGCLQKCNLASFSEIH